jgi:NAD(P)-dependent dehydrogenase (short-subunit alcohol dehydrogenase family)
VSSRHACAAIVAPDRPFVEELVHELGIDVVHVDLDEFDPASRDVVSSSAGLVWMHRVPAGPAHESELHEAMLLLRSARLALRAATEAGVRLTFIALLPSRGLLTGRTGLACELARGALGALMSTEIGSWSAGGHRLVGVVYPGLDGHRLEDQRPDVEVRRRAPIGALAAVSQLADAIRYVGSARAAYMTGTFVHVDGGWRAYSWVYPVRTI